MNCGECRECARDDLLRGYASLRCMVTGRLIGARFPTEISEAAAGETKRPAWCGTNTFPRLPGKQWPKTPEPWPTGGGGEHGTGI